jgi:tetratricopeptide (TPR) repeat protein
MVSNNFYHTNDLFALDNTQKLFEEAEQLDHSGDFQSALEKYKEIISLDPSFTGAYRGVNKCYTALDDPKGALMYMESLFLEYPERGEVSYGLGYSLYNSGKYDEALRYFKKAIELNSNIAAAWNNCAVVYHFIVKDFRKAGYYYEKAIEISKITGDDFVLNVAQKNIANIPEHDEIEPLTEKISLQDFINQFISFAENNKHKEMTKLIAGQKENSKNAMDWYIGKALQAYSSGNFEDEKTLILLADILQEEYSIIFREPDLFDLFIKYKNLSNREKKNLFKNQ